LWVPSRETCLNINPYCFGLPYAREIKVGHRTLSELLESPQYQSKMEQSITKLIKIVGMELVEKYFEFEDRVENLTKERKVGRPKKPRTVGRPKQ